MCHGGPALMTSSNPKYLPDVLPPESVPLGSRASGESFFKSLFIFEIERA